MNYGILQNSIPSNSQKLEKYLGSISDMNRLPAAVFIIDVLKEKIAVAEAAKLNIMTFAMVDTNSDPSMIDYPIPSNDDASKSIEIILSSVVDAISEGLDEREQEKQNNENQKKEDSKKKVSSDSKSKK